MYSQLTEYLHVLVNRFMAWASAFRYRLIKLTFSLVENYMYGHGTGTAWYRPITLLFSIVEGHKSCHCLHVHDYMFI